MEVFSVQIGWNLNSWNEAELQQFQRVNMTFFLDLIRLKIPQKEQKAFWVKGLKLERQKATISAPKMVECGLEFLVSDSLFMLLFIFIFIVIANIFFI